MKVLRQLGIAIILLVAPAAFAHEAGSRVAEQRWSFEPAIVVPLALAAGLFVIGAWRRRHRPGWSVLQLALFAAGWVTLFIALVTPVHALGTALFSVHMAQHELLMIVAAPLLVLSRPLLWFLWALPRGWRESVGSFAKRSEIAALWSVMTVPLFVWLLHGVTLWAWHIPVLYDASVEHEWVHAFQHSMFLRDRVAVLVDAHTRPLWPPLLWDWGYILLHTALHTSILGALMTFAQQVWYPIYQTRTAEFHLTPLEDQQIGGLIMWVPAGVIFIILGLWLTARWIRDSERRVRYSCTEQTARQIAAHAPSGDQSWKRKLALVVACVFVLGATSCDPATPNYISQVKYMTGGDPDAGRLKIRNYGCQACHTIPGVVGANALVGPPLIHWSRRTFIAGELPNTPENLTRWIQHPQQIEPKTAMPEMGVTDQDSRDIAAYLYTLR